MGTIPLAITIFCVVLGVIFIAGLVLALIEILPTVLQRGFQGWEALGWGLLFGLTMTVCFGFFLISPFLGYGLPAGVSTHSNDVDGLFNIIAAVTGFFFVLTEGLLAYCIVRFGSGPLSLIVAPVAGVIVNFIKRFIPTEHRLELAWTIVPAAILLYIAVAQIGTWAEIKYQSRMPDLQAKQPPLPIAVSARQFEWRMRYPNPKLWGKIKSADPKMKRTLIENWSKNAQLDDVHVTNELHVWTNENPKTPGDYPPFVVYLSTIDVQHNFNLPHFRVKQDALPGKIIPVWFRPMKSNGKLVGGDWNYEKYDDGKPVVWEIACAELCGRWHYHMIGRIYVHPSEANFLQWLTEAAAETGKTTRK